MDPLDGAIKTESFLTMLIEHKDPRDRRNFTGERITSATTDLIDTQSPEQIVSECELRDIEEGWPPGTALALFIEENKT